MTTITKLRAAVERRDTCLRFYSNDRHYLTNNKVVTETAEGYVVSLKDGSPRCELDAPRLFALRVYRPYM